MVSIQHLMNKFDIIMIVITGFCLVRGLFRGLIKELSSIIGVIGGFYAATTYYRFLADYLSRWKIDPVYANILSSLILFCAVFFIISILGVLIRYILNLALLGWADRGLGAGFGVVKAVLIGAALLAIFTRFLPVGASMVKDSKLAPHIMMVSENMIKLVSRDIKNEFTSKIGGLKKAWNLQ